MRAAIIGNKEGLYNDCRTNTYYIDETKAENYNNVSMENVNHIVIDRAENGTFAIVQASGWSADRGSFVDLY